MLRLSKPLLAVVFIIYFLYLIASKAPAVLLASAVQKATPHAQLSNVSGTLWSGRAASALVDVSGVKIDTGGLRWTISPWTLLTLKGCINLQSEVVSGEACRSVFGANKLFDMQLDLPVSKFDRFIPEMNVDGLGSLNIVEAAFDDAGTIDTLQGQFSVRQTVVSAGGMTFNLGDYAADLKENGEGGVALNIFDLKGPITIKLQASAGVTAPPTASGEIILKPEAPPQIEDALSLIAAPLETGGYKITYPLGG